MDLLTLNTLLLLDPKQRGDDNADELRNVKNLPDKLKAGIIKVVVLEQKAPNGQTQLQLPSGQIITADVPEDIPPGSQLLLRLRGQQDPQILRVLLPKTADAPAQLRPSGSQPVLLDIAENATAKVGQTIRFTPPLNTAPQTTAFMPSPGMSVMGRTLTPPQQGAQTLNLTNGHQLRMMLPPVFEVNSEVVLKVGQNQTATIDKLTLPAPLQPPIDAGIELTEDGNGQAPRQIMVSGTGKIAAQGRVLLPTPLSLQIGRAHV